jgi:hypothetical protein
MAEPQKDTNQTPSKDERLAKLETDNATLREALSICLEAVIEGAVYGQVKRAREGALKAALAGLTVAE